MGMYTEFHFNSSIKKDTPKEVVEILIWMVRGEYHERPKNLPKHKFFECSRWAVLFRMDSYYFDAKTNSYFEFDDVSKCYYLNIKSNLKNYDDEISEFLDWIHPYLDKFDGEFLGFYRYEEYENPTLLYHGSNEIEHFFVSNHREEP